MQAAALLLELVRAVYRERAAARHLTCGKRGWAPRRYRASLFLMVLATFTLAASVAFGQVAPGNMPSGLLDAYALSKAPAIAAFNQYAGRLFRALALLEMAWAAILLALERADLQSWTAGFLRKFLVLWFFLYLLQQGPFISDAILDSFTTMGTQIAGLPGGASPGDVFLHGVSLAGTLLSKADWTGFLFNPAPAVMVILSALIMFLSFVVITCHYIMAQVESYIVVSAGLIFLGFGGNAVTRPYVERFFALSVAVGVKLMVLYVVIGVGNVLTQNWVNVANNISLTVFPITDVLYLVGGCLIYAAVAWGVPKFAASVLSASPAFSGGDLMHVGMAGATMGMMAIGGAGLALRGVAAAGSAAGGASGGATNIGAASAVPAAGGRGPAGPGGANGASGAPGKGGGGGNGSGGSGGADGAYSPSQPSPPSSGPANGGGASATNGSGAGATGASAAVPSADSSNGTVAAYRVPQPAPPRAGGSTEAAAGGASDNPSAASQGPAVSPVLFSGGTTGYAARPPVSPPSSGPGTPPANPATSSSASTTGTPNSGSGDATPTRPSGAANPRSASAAERGATTSPSAQTQPPPPNAGWENVDKVGAALMKGARNAEHVTYFLARMVPPDGGGGGTPPQMNIHE